jgi:hypothetical protein
MIGALLARLTGLSTEARSWGAGHAASWMHGHRAGLDG